MKSKCFPFGTSPHVHSGRVDPVCLLSGISTARESIKCISLLSQNHGRFVSLVYASLTVRSLQILPSVPRPCPLAQTAPRPSVVPLLPALLQADQEPQEAPPAEDTLRLNHQASYTSHTRQTTAMTLPATSRFPSPISPESNIRRPNRRIHRVIRRH